MLIELIQIFRARRDPQRAARLAGRLAQNQAIDRLTAPLLLVHILLWGLIIIAIGVAAALLYLAAHSHWSVGLATVLPITIAGLSGALSFGLKAGLDRVRDHAGRIGDLGVEKTAQFGRTVRGRLSRPNAAPAEPNKPTPVNVDER
ncbi:hypothetical protein ACFFUB_12755 [Algimonas porphyrae]|uniref:Phage holin family protein n=1 Tax=Algimonas porphyrae TaxID=1128113 RepID=A0ABQ5UXI2_9PROT|nr:hypothetical protein [Algimonas porphyrae]GLQ19283.1 hypothetical protein GCM10007854_02380 [Algimonas porphyrae]